MILEIVGGLLLFAFGSIAIAEWFAIQKLNQYLQNSDDAYDRALDEFYNYLWQESD